ncbi:nuclear transport factor 2 family protein [Streptomyces sp. APSN-46.1]|uniref:YybH family protein n=1 Tax=Streptomyces sp. APSN-46.1 TaxID=2929049 RepID=UPI001FB4A382|nr:nuclear transport factor 2 family protein [Streptomyces sp. APSN-46.1]MCJ1676158.1 nuclear transport factor 2 family protein [Streptomyces sp. APSN-46.1]
MPAPARTPETAAAVWQVITTMYEAYSAGDRARIDACLDQEATVWDSGTAELLFGKPDLDRVREERPTAGKGPTETGLETYGQVVDVFGDIAVLRFWLRVEFAPDASAGELRPELVRNTAVLRRGGDARWRIVHLHEDVRQPGGIPVGDH